MMLQTAARRSGHPTMRRLLSRALTTLHVPNTNRRFPNPRMISHDLFSRWFASDSDDITTSQSSSTTGSASGDSSASSELDSTDSENERPHDGIYLSGASTLIEPDTKSHSQKTLDNLPITFADISRAEVAIRGGVKRTTCEKSHFISELCDTNVYFKNEFRQFTGSFKERGARNAILKLIRDKGPSLRGVIAASAGNHALAIAYHGQQVSIRLNWTLFRTNYTRYINLPIRNSSHSLSFMYHGQQLGIPVTVVMPTTAPLAKVDKCRVRSKRSICYVNE